MWRIEAKEENDQNEEDRGYSHGVFNHRKKIAAPRMPKRMPNNGLKIANQKETSQPESRVVEFVFTLFYHGFEGRNFTK